MATEREITQGDTSQAAATGDMAGVGGAFIRMQSLGSEATESAKVAEYLISSGGGPPAIAPRVDDAVSDMIVRNSWAILGIIGALLDNVYGAPVDVEPVVDPSSDEGKRTIRRWIRLQRTLRGSTDMTHLEISEAALTRACKWIESRIEYEMAMAEGFFATCAVDQDLQTTRMLTGFDLETRGRAEIEVLRSMDGEPCGLQWASARYIRIEPKGAIIGYEDIDIYNPLVQLPRSRYRRFHGFYQVTAAPGSGVYSYFREYGDPRIRSRTTGKYGYATVDDLEETERNKSGSTDGAFWARAAWPPGTPATEILHFVIHAPWAESTGLAPYYGALPEALGIRDLAEENRGLLSGQLVPLLLMMVSGGARIGPDQQQIWQEQFKSIQPGERGLVIMQVLSQAAAASGLKGSGEPKIQIENTRPAQQDDALGLNYTAACEKAVRRNYKIPRAVLGDLEDVSHQTLSLAYRYAESQVYEPRRDPFNRKFDEVLRGLGLYAVKTYTRPRATMHLGEISEALERLSNSSLITPEDVRPLIRRLVRDVDSLGGQVWAKLPRRIVESYMMARVPQAAATLLELDEEHSPPPETYLDPAREVLNRHLAEAEEGTSGEVSEQEQQEEAQILSEDHDPLADPLADVATRESGKVPGAKEQ